MWHYFGPNLSNQVLKATKLQKQPWFQQTINLDISQKLSRALRTKLGTDSSKQDLEYIFATTTIWILLFHAIFIEKPQLYWQLLSWFSVLFGALRWQAGNWPQARKKINEMYLPVSIQFWKRHLHGGSGKSAHTCYKFFSSTFLIKYQY